MSDGKTNVLVVAADETAASDELLEAARERAESGDVAFTLLVPATPAENIKQVGDLEPDPDHAERQVKPGLERLREAGLEVEGRIGDSEPVSATEDAVNFGDYDEVMVVTTRRTVTKLARMDLPRRIEGATSLPVTHVTASKVEPDD